MRQARLRERLWRSFNAIVRIKPERLDRGGGFASSLPLRIKERELFCGSTRGISREMGHHKVFVAVARLEDELALRWLLRPIKNAEDVRTVLRRVRTSILCPLYDDEMRVARYIVLDIDSHMVGCHSVTDISPQEADRITAGCVGVSNWSPSAFDAVVDRVLGGTTQHVQ